VNVAEVTLRMLDRRVVVCRHCWCIGEGPKMTERGSETRERDAKDEMERVV
jgi:hypothetical protein